MDDIVDFDLAIGEAVLAGRMFQKPPSDDQKRAAGRRWFDTNKDAVRQWCLSNPKVVSFFSEKNRSRNDLMSIAGDVVLFGTIGIPVSMLLLKISEYGYSRLTEPK